MPGPVFLRGDQVTLRLLEEADAPFLQETINDPAVRHGLAASVPMSESAEREWIESANDPDSDEVHLLICVDEEPVGTIGLNDVANQAGVAEIGYFLAPEAWGNGYATDATRTLAAYAFEERRLHRVYAKAFAGNEGSKRVLEKVGFEKEGVLREHWFREGRHEDIHVYGLLAEELDRGTQ